MVPGGDSGGAAASPPGTEAGQAAFLKQMREMLGPMLPAMQAAGVPIPEESALAMPQVYLDADVTVVARAVADLCHGEELFKMDKSVVTIDAATGRTEGMTPAAFVSWMGERAKFWTAGKEGQSKFKSLTEQDAKLILCSEIFRRRLREVVAVNLVRLPVVRAWDEAGCPQVELLPRGYDAGSKIFTAAGGVDYREDVAVDEAQVFFRRLLGSFPFGDAEQGLGNTVAYLLTLYCRGMILPSKCPVFSFMANLPGSGKGILAALGLNAVFGKVQGMGLPEPGELKKVLDMAAQHAAPYLFFDNLRGTLKSTWLEAWTTMDEWSGRVIGLGVQFSMPAAAVLIVTGNGLKLGEDMERRTVKIDLFPDQLAEDRPAPAEPITGRWLRRPGNRARVLECLWALVRYAYSAEGVALGVKTGKPLESFEDWSETVAPVCVRCGFADPLVKVVLPDGGNTDNDDGKRMMLAVIASMHLMPGECKSITLADLVPFARRVGAFSSRIDTIENICVKLDGMRDGWKEEDWGDGLDRLPGNDFERREQAAKWIDPDKQRGTMTSMSYQIRKSSIYGRRVELTPAREGDWMTSTGTAREVYVFGSRDWERKSTFEVRRVE